jgi:putative ABC transport system permease protein
MFRNYLIIGFRNLVKNRLFSVINIFGMATSLTIFIIITMFVVDELSFDRGVKDSDLKYRVYTEHFSDDGSVRKSSMISPMIGPTLVSEFPEVEYATRFLSINGKILFHAADKKLTETDGGYADSTIFKMFGLRFVEGDPERALSDPLGIVLTQSLARKYFGTAPALGHPIEVNNEKLIVSGVYEDFDPHSHLQLRYLLPMRNLEREIPQRMRNWGWNQFHSYIKLKPGAKEHNLESKLLGFAQRNAWPSTKANGSYYIPHLMPLKKIHLYASDQQWDIAVRGNIQTVYILSATALFILVIAVLNFVNLSTARAMARVKEVGVRKVMGAIRWQLVWQFISESVIIVTLALLIAILLIELIMPAINSFTGKAISLSILLSPAYVAAIVGFALFVGFAAGIYPAFYISGHRPAEILASKNSMRSGKATLRSGLVVLQFILSFFLITASIIVSDQHNFMRTKDMGFNKDNLIVISLEGDMRKNFELTKNAFSDNPGVINATLGYGLPGEAYAGDGIIDKEKSKEWPISMLTVDEDYVKTLGLKIIAGRDFKKEIKSDELHGFILSEAAAKMLGHQNAEDAIGHRLAWNRWDNPDSLKQGTVIGVVKDIHLNSLKENITPVILHVFPFAYSTMTLRVKSESIPATIEHLEKVWKKFNSDWPFEYRFLDDNFDKMYKAEEKLATLFKCFTGFTIFVASLGLFGLVVYSTSLKYKEISIRKVLGAEELTLVVQLGRNYVMLVVLAFIVAIPFSYYAAELWLEKFAYRIDVTAGLFIKSSVLILLISMITVGIQSLRAARANPVDALKDQ